MDWLKYAIKRLLLLIPVIIGVTFVLFVILSFAPGDVVRSILGDEATAEQIAELRHEMYLDRPLLVRYLKYMADAFTFDFGQSWTSGYEILPEFARRLPYTLSVTTLSVLFAVALGIPLGIISAVKEHSLLARNSLSDPLLPYAPMASRLRSRFMEALYPSFNNPRGINPCYDDPYEQDKYARCN